MKFKGKLFDHQFEAKIQILNARYCILAHDMGLGKSITALAVACQLNKKTLIVCPAYLRKKWQEEDIEQFVEGYEDNFKIISYGDLAREEIDRYDIVIADEAHYLKNLKAQRTKAFHNYIVKQMPEYLMLLSGTPIKNRVPEIFSLLQLCFYGGRYESFSPFYRLPYKFYEYYSIAVRKKFAGRAVTTYEGVKNVDSLINLLKPIRFRKRADVVDLPKQNYRNIVIKEKSDYDNKLAKALELFEATEDPAYMSLKAANALAKTPATIELAQTILDSSNKLVIFTDHIVACQEIASALKVPAVTGSMSADNRSIVVDRFRKGMIDVVVATIGSLSTGVNLNVANYMIFNDFPYVPADLEQAEKRIHRIGQDKPCFYYYVFSSQIDKNIYGTVRKKMKVINEVNDDT